MFAIQCLLPIISLMMVQLEPKRAGEFRIQNNRYLHLLGRCILLVILDILWFISQ